MGVDRRDLALYGPQAAADDFVVDWQLIPPPEGGGPLPSRMEEQAPPREWEKLLLGVPI